MTKSAAKFVLAAPYPEGAIVGLARSLSDRGLLTSLYMPSRSVARAAARASLVLRQTSRAKRLLRGASDVEQLQEVLPSLEFRRLFHKALNSPMDMDAFKKRFDEHVARVVPTAPETLIGMPGACLALFERFDESLRVFHEVDAHPRFHNEALLAVYDEIDVRRELHPNHYVERVEAEIHLADLILSPSSLVTGQMRDNGVDKKKVVQIPYAVDLERFSPPKTERTSGRPRLVYVGQISRRKGIPFLIEAMRSATPELVLIGPLVDPSLIEGLPANVTYAGVLPHEDLTAALSLADAFVFPSIEDNFALVVLEAVGTGLPVITTANVGSSELLDPQDVTLVTPGSTGELLAAISSVEPLTLHLRQERADRVRRSSNGRAQGQLLDWDTYGTLVADQILNHQS
ncbi:glycosyltransferase [Cryobacterium sp. TMT1-21]|uniref:glycosyltransferase family 4 protein n=1 Tax=Cryobacterium sp. TMT1-21 TaxID=1259234 RepID=UPI001069B50F|nr:glycosyltransferase family 4 protein [Cryobacterium sp. TMT1-21]TFD17285.1 glycosyltransferase [Cryobacterium sp. TMT1-21]